MGVERVVMVVQEQESEHVLYPGRTSCSEQESPRMDHEEEKPRSRDHFQSSTSGKEFRVHEEINP
jgi:hypothetical protein